MAALLLEARRLALGDHRGRIKASTDDDMPLKIFEEGYQSEDAFPEEEGTS